MLSSTTLNLAVKPPVNLNEQVAAYRLNGSNALSANRPAEAADAFRRGLELAPTDPELLGGLGNALFIDGKYAEAIAAFERALP